MHFFPVCFLHTPKPCDPDNLSRPLGHSLFGSFLISGSRRNGSDQKVTTGVFYYKWTPFLALFRRPNFRAHFVCTRPNPATRIIVTTPTERTRRSREPALQQIQIKPWSLSTFCVRPAPPFSSMFTAQQVVALCFFSLA